MKSLIGSPSSVTEPDHGSSYRKRSWTSVDLPDPECPTRIMCPPAGTSKVTLDGEPISDFTLDSLRHKVVAVSQRNQLLNASIAENLRLGAPNATDSELWKALETAGLASEIREMPDGLATGVGQNGSALSGGQYQRLCLARALLMSPRVLVLDEFTANLNTALEDQIRAALAEWTDELTVIEVTHRLRATEFADVVAVIDRGRVVLSGPPSEVTRDVIEDHFFGAVDS